MPADLYSLLYADEPTAQEQAAAMASVLGRQRAAGMLAQLSGDRVLAPSGQAMLAGADKAQAQIADTAGARLRAALERSQQAMQGQHWQAQLEQQAKQHAAQIGVERARIGLQRQQLDQDAFTAVADPVSGGVVIFNKKTGQRVGQAPSVASAPNPAPGPEVPPLLARPGASAAANSGGLKESQRNAAVRVGEGSIGMENAIAAGFPNNKNLGGLTEGVGWKLAETWPALVSAETEQRKGFWENVADPIVRARTGAAMPVEEFRKQMTMLIPRPGESEETHIKKARQLVDFFKNGTVGLPPQVQGPLLQQLDALAAQLPGTVEDYQRMKQGGGAPPGAPRDASTLRKKYGL